MLRIPGTILRTACLNPFALALLLSACAQNALPRPVSSQPLAVPQISGLAALSLRIDVPPAGARAARYVGRAARSIAVKLYPSTNGRAVTTYVNLTAASNPRCTALASKVVRCRIGLRVPTGNYRGSFTVYDGPLSARGLPTGNALSANQQLPIFVPSYGVSIALGIYLNGIPQSVRVTAPMAGNQSGGFSLLPCQRFPQIFTVEGVDADGNVMLGPGAPAASLKPRSKLATATPSGPQSPNSFIVDAAAGKTSGTSALTATVTAPASAGSRSAQATVRVSIDPRHPSGCLLVANEDSDGDPPVPNIAIYAPGSSAPASTVGDGIGIPGGFAFDAAGHVYVATYGPTVAEYASNSGTPMRTLACKGWSDAVAVDGSGNVYIADGDGEVVVYGPAGTTPRYTINVAEPTALAFDTAGNLYVASSTAPDAGTVSVYPPGSATASKTLTVGVEASALAFDGDGDLYVANYYSNTISVFAPGASSATYTIAHGVSKPESLAVDNANNLYVANYGTSKVTVYPEGATTPSRRLSTGRYTSALTVDSSNRLYVGTTKNVRVYLPGSSAPVRTITNGVAAASALAVTP